MLPAPEAVSFAQALVANDARIRLSNLDDGREITAERTAIFARGLERWAQERAVEFSRHFAVAVLGGTGRGELTPCSDLDVVFLFEDPVEEGETRVFLTSLQEETLHTLKFRDRYGFSFRALPYSFEDIPSLREKNLNSFLDLVPLYDPHGLCVEFRHRIRDSFDPFEHFLHVRKLWLRQLERPGAAAERVDRFDLKNDALRVFLAAVWTLGGKKFEHSHRIYERIAEKESRDLEAYYFLLRLRSWIHLQRPCGVGATVLGTHAEDTMAFEDFDSFGSWLPEGASEKERFEFAEEVLTRLLDARRRVAAFSRGVIEGELRPGRRVSEGNPVALGAGGLFHMSPETCTSSGECSRAALSLVMIAQRYGLQIDPAELQSTFYQAGDWLEPVPELGNLFLDTHGGLAESFDFLSRIPGAMERLFPGYGRYEVSLDARVKAERQWLRGALEREKLRELEAERREGEQILAAPRGPDHMEDAGYDFRVEVEAARLTNEQLAAVKLALKTKRLPVSARASAENSSTHVADLFTTGFSGIPLEEYYGKNFEKGGFPRSVLDLTQFLVENRNLFFEIADSGLIDRTTVAEFRNRCGGDREKIRTLYVFTRIDRHAWGSPQQMPTLFFNVRELYAKAMMLEERQIDPVKLLEDAGVEDVESRDILLDFGRDFYEGIYRTYAIKFGHHLLKLADPKRAVGPKAILMQVRHSKILAVLARDDRGIAASISGAFWRHGVGLSQAHLFSAAKYGLAFDFFHLSPVTDAQGSALTTDIAKQVEEAIRSRLHRSDEDEVSLPDVARNVTLTEWRHGLCRLRAESNGEVGALIYLLCYKATRRLGANIHGVTSQTDHNGARASVFLRLPDHLALSDARVIVGAWG